MRVSWDEVARYVVRDANTLDGWAALIEKHPTRFLFGTDSVAPMNWDAYVTTHKVYHPLWEQLDAELRAQVEWRNYERVFDAAVPRVRAWEQRQLSMQSLGSP